MSVGQTTQKRSKRVHLQPRSRRNRAENTPSPRTPRGDLVHDHLELVLRSCRSVARRLRIAEQDRADFVSWTVMRLLERGDRVLASYRGESPFESFVMVVIANLGRDYRNLRWGKWAPSALARREGPDAIALEKLIHRDGASPSEAVRILANRDDTMKSESELRLLANTLSTRVRKEFAQLDDSIELPSGHRTDALVLDRERDKRVGRAASRLRSLIDDLPDEDRVLVRMRYFDGLRVSEIAQMLSLPQKPLYRRFEKILMSLRAGLESTDSDLPEWLAA